MTVFAETIKRNAGNIVTIKLYRRRLAESLLVANDAALNEVQPSNLKDRL